MKETTHAAADGARSTAPFLSVRTAAAMLGIHSATLYRAIKNEECPLGPPIKLGRRLAFRRADVLRFISGDTEAQP